MGHFDRSLRLFALACLLLGSGAASAEFCGTASNQAHVAAGRAEAQGYYYAVAKGSKDHLGMLYTDSSTLRETAPGYFVKTDSCPPPKIGPYEGAYEHDAPTILDITGNLGVVMGGGHYLASQGNGSAFPRESVYPSTSTLEIPPGATIRHAFLYYGGVMGLEGGDFTPDELGSFEDVRHNGLIFSINDGELLTYDPTGRQPPKQSAVGSEAKMSEPYSADFGTLTGTSTAFWSNRLDITGLLQAAGDGSIKIQVQRPERIDVNVNDAQRNGGNPAGETLYNSCMNVGNWGVVVIYEHPEEPLRQLIMKDDIVRAWDYIWFHKGVWQRPKVVFSHHAPMLEGAKIYLMGQTGNPAGTVTPSQPACTCGCGGSWNLKNIGKSAPYTKSGRFWSYTLVDPAPTWDDPLHRDSSNGNWELVSQTGTGGRSLRGNDWTLFQSGERYTEFPNLFEGKDTPADDIQPITQENVPDTAGDVYAGHPWKGRGEVKYHATGNDLSMIEITPDADALELGSTTSALFFKGDQKDVFKPQERVTVRFMMLSIPLQGEQPVNRSPIIALIGDNPLRIKLGSEFVDPGATAFDPEDGDLTAKIQAVCKVDTSVAGDDYRCEYTVADEEGKTARATRTIVVFSDDDGGGNEFKCEEFSAAVFMHQLAQRVYNGGTIFLPRYYAVGSDEPLGMVTMMTNVTLHRFEGDSSYHVGACP